VRIRSPATCARSGATAANATAPGRSRPPWKGRGVTASRRRIGNIMREQGMTSAYARGRSEPHRTRADEARLANLLDPRVRRLRPAHASGERSYLCPRRRRLGVRVPAGRPGGQGNRRPFRRTAPRRGPGREQRDAGPVRTTARVTVERETSAPCSSPDRSQILVAVCRCLRQFARSPASHCCDRGQIRVRPPTRAASSPTARPTDPPSPGTCAPSAPPACVFRAIDATDSPFRHKRRIDCTWGVPVIILPGPFWWRYKHHPVKTNTWSACSA
jgi:hypothetical protein